MPVSIEQRDFHRTEFSGFVCGIFAKTVDKFRFYLKSRTEMIGHLNVRAYWKLYLVVVLFVMETVFSARCELGPKSLFTV